MFGSVCSTDPKLYRIPCAGALSVESIPSGIGNSPRLVFPSVKNIRR